MLAIEKLAHFREEDDGVSSSSSSIVDAATMRKHPLQAMM
jgi:hypothetical protein